ncbi:hypothetical protein [Baekduia sp. Peel2402]|uniref:hypothetical protein n=1 Tax=Baekduia sp. Peel2402 TaxID=3458296 RepID=UPI00403EC279
MVLVEDRAWTRRVPELDLWCDEREVPVNLQDTHNNWLGGVYMRQSPPLSSGAAAEVSGRVALAIGDGRLVGIISPDEATEPAIWFSIALDDLLMVEVISRHRLTWRPRKITVYVPGWALVFVAIARHDGSREWRGQERSLLRALGGPTPWRKRWAVIRRLYGRRRRFVP